MVGWSWVSENEVSAPGKCGSESTYARTVILTYCPAKGERFAPHSLSWFNSLLRSKSCGEAHKAVTAT